MSLNEFAFMSAVLTTLATLRFGLPLAITWLVGKAANRITHAA